MPAVSGAGRLAWLLCLVSGPSSGCQPGWAFQLVLPPRAAPHALSWQQDSVPGIYGTGDPVSLLTTLQGPLSALVGHPQSGFCGPSILTPARGRIPCFPSSHSGEMVFSWS